MSVPAENHVSNDLEEKKQQPVVLVTGFKPFGTHVVNASWEAVSLLPKSELEDELGIRLEVIRLPVEYESVSKIVPRLWQELDPVLVVHVGVSSIARAITLEQEAHNEGYSSVDTCCCLPPNGVCVAKGPPVISSMLDMGQVCRAINSDESGIMACVSRDPGRYLCDFTYYCSLTIKKECTAFIHVPCLNSPYSAEELSHGIKIALKNMLEQVKYSP